MIQGNVETLDTSAASILGLEPVRHVGHEQRKLSKPKDRGAADRWSDRKGLSGRHSARQFHTHRRQGRDRRRSRRRRQRAERTHRRARRNDCRRRKGEIYLGDTELTARSPKEITAAGIGIVPEDRHAVGCVTGMTLAENIYLNRLDEFTRFGFLKRSALEREAAQ